MTDPEGDADAGPERALLKAVTAISSDLDLHSVLTRIVSSAVDLTDARYGALGVVGGDDDDLVELVTTRTGPPAPAIVGRLPVGRGRLRHADGTTPEAGSGPPPRLPAAVTFLVVPVRIRGTVFGNLYLTEKRHDQPFSDADENLVQALATAAGYVIDNARAYGLSERRGEWLEAAAERTVRGQHPIDLQRARQQIATAARAVSRSMAAAVISLPAGQPPGVVAFDGSPDHLDRRLLARIASALEAQQPSTSALEVRVAALVAVAIPLRAHLAERGALVAVYDAGYRSDDVEERELLASFADQAALALDRAQALVDRQDLALVSDRERIARDLHDLVIQRLFATGLQLQGIRSQVSEPQVLSRIGQAIDALDMTVKDIRGTIFALEARWPDSVRGRVAALVLQYVPILGFTPTLHVSGPVDTEISTDVAEHLLAVLREAISNVTRHALASRGIVEVHVDGSELRLVVLDDGVGPSPGGTGSGLRNARRRAADLGGSLEVTRREPRGTSFTWRVPLGPRPE